MSLNYFIKRLDNAVKKNALFPHPFRIRPTASLNKINNFILTSSKNLVLFVFNTQFSFMFFKKKIYPLLREFWGNNNLTSPRPLYL